MECLIGFVGLAQNCNLPPALSGLYLTDLPGMTFNKIQEITEADQQTFNNTWDLINRRASRRFTLDIIGAFDDRRKNGYALRHLTQQADLGKTFSQSPPTGVPNALIPQSNVYYGHTIELNNPQDVCVCSVMQAIHIQQVNFYLPQEHRSPDVAMATISIVDADSLEILFVNTFTANAAAWNTVWVDQIFPNSRRLFVLVSGSTIDNLASQDISVQGLTGFAPGLICSSCSYTANAFGLWLNWGECGCQSQVQGVNCDAEFNPTYGTNIYGVSTVFDVRCTYNNIICNNKSYFANAWLYCLGIETCDEILYSTRLNRWTTTDKKTAMDQKKLYMQQYRGGYDTDSGIAYEGILRRAVETIPLNGSDCCFEKDSWIEWRTSVL